VKFPNSAHSSDVALRQAGPEDIGCINPLIAAAMTTWDVTERVRRISLPLYQYRAHDLEHLFVLVAETPDSGIVGVAAIEAAETSQCPGNCNGALLHGIYMLPGRHRQGIGFLLLEKMAVIASSRDFDGLLVKAKREAVSFFEACGYVELPIEDYGRDYPYRYWKGF